MTPILKHPQRDFFVRNLAPALQGICGAKHSASHPYLWEISSGYLCLVAVEA